MLFSARLIRLQEDVNVFQDFGKVRPFGFGGLSGSPFRHHRLRSRDGTGGSFAAVIGGSLVEGQSRCR